MARLCPTVDTGISCLICTHTKYHETAVEVKESKCSRRNIYEHTIQPFCAKGGVHWSKMVSEKQAAHKLNLQNEERLKAASEAKLERQRAAAAAAIKAATVSASKNASGKTQKRSSSARQKQEMLRLRKLQLQHILRQRKRKKKEKKKKAWEQLQEMRTIVEGLDQARWSCLMDC